LRAPEVPRSPWPRAKLLKRGRRRDNREAACLNEKKVLRLEGCHLHQQHSEKVPDWISPETRMAQATVPIRASAAS
jgi:hypothetical protein